MSAPAAAERKTALWVDGTNCPRRDAKYFDEMKRAGVAASVITSPHWDAGFHKAVLDVVGDVQWLEDNAKEARLATTVAEIRRASEEGHAAIILAPQDGKIIEDQVRFLRVFDGLGVKILELTHMRRNFIGDGAIDAHVRQDSGLSVFGLDVVKEMNRLGMVIDVGHSGHQTTMDAIEASEQPVIFSHTNVHALCDNPRNKRDEAIVALAENGGVMGLTAYAQFCETERGKWPTLEDFLKHVDYVVKLVGVEHVGVSLDIDEVGYPKEVVRGLTYDTDTWDDFKQKYPGMTRPPYDEWVPPNGYPLVEGMENLECYARIEGGLLERGYSRDDTDKIMGENWLRVFEQVWGS